MKTGERWKWLAVPFAFGWLLVLLRLIQSLPAAMAAQEPGRVRQLAAINILLEAMLSGGVVLVVTLVLFPALPPIKWRHVGFVSVLAAAIEIAAALSVSDARAFGSLRWLLPTGVGYSLLLIACAVGLRTGTSSAA